MIPFQQLYCKWTAYAGRGLSTDLKENFLPWSHFAPKKKTVPPSYGYVSSLTGEGPFWTYSAAWEYRGSYVLVVNELDIYNVVWIQGYFDLNVGWLSPDVLFFQIVFEQPTERHQVLGFDQYTLRFADLRTCRSALRSIHAVCIVYSSTSCIISLMVL